jgi:soluble lytic murein transglycosylase-like protein
VIRFAVPLALAGLHVWIGRRQQPVPPKSFPRGPLTLQTLGELVYALDAPPVAPSLMLALAERESSLDPTELTGSFRGLYQVGPKVLEEFAADRSAEVRPDDLYQPSVAVDVAAWHLGRIVDLYRRHGLTAAHPDFEYLVVVGWNAGHSEAAGVAYLWDRSGGTLTRANLQELAMRHGAAAPLRDRSRPVWWASVVERARELRALGW